MCYPLIVAVIGFNVHLNVYSDRLSVCRVDFTREIVL